MIGLVLISAAACDRDAPVAPPAGKPVNRAANGMVQLTDPEIARAGIEVMMVQKEPFTFHRKFPALVSATEN